MNKIGNEGVGGQISENIMIKCMLDVYVQDEVEEETEGEGMLSHYHEKRSVHCKDMGKCSFTWGIFEFISVNKINI